MSSSVWRFGFVSREIIPFVNEWDEAGTFPRHLYRSVAELCAMFWILPRLVVCPAEVLRPVAGIRRPDLHPRRSNLTQDRPTGAP
jgi:hypothetical protein